MAVRKVTRAAPATEAGTPPVRAVRRRPAVRKGIQSIEIGFRILDFLVKAGRPVPLREIAAGTGLPPSNVHFYLISLIQVGAVRQDRSARNYGLGPYALQLGVAGLEQFDLLSASREALSDLAVETGHTAFLGVWGNHGPTIVYRVDGPQSRSVFELRIGSVLPVLRSALGRNLLAYLPTSLTGPFFERELSEIALAGLRQADPDMPRTREEVTALIDQVRRRGMSRCRRTLLSDYTALSAPIFDYSGTIVAGVTLMGPVGILDDAYEGPVAVTLRTIAHRISREAGHGPAHGPSSR